MLNISIVQKKPMQITQMQMLMKITEEYLRSAQQQKANIIVFPEYYNVPINEDIIQNKALTKNHYLSIFSSLAKEYEIWMFVPLVFKENTQIYNAILVFNDLGHLVSEYIKIHLVASEPEIFEEGDSLQIVKTPWGNIGLAICYDIHFPNVFREYAKNNVDAVIIPSTIRKQRVDMWNLLVRTRAYENHMYMIACNSIGENNIENSKMSNRFKEMGGMTCIIGPDGKNIVSAGLDCLVISASIDLKQSQYSKLNYSNLELNDGPYKIAISD
ncbi:carbon-nitrogen hydrolase family protein [Cysteiniphilum halobium]|uniref:carbon-nitrogen hydrolase family protein n=1 Tax=Cysteiniphilum halobium TaxID=2219059 RepID=UPI003F84E7C6